MVPAWTLFAALPFACLVAVTLTFIVTRALSRKAAPVPSPVQGPISAPAKNTLVDVDVLSIMSQRLAVLEGRLPALQQLLDGYGALSTRVAEMEARLPTLADAYDRFGSLVVNAEKRRRESDRHQKNKPLSVEEVAAQAGLATGLPGSPAAASGEPSSVRAGVVGGNGVKSRGQ